MASTIDQRMGAFDAVMWNVEEDPVLRSVIVAMMLLDKTPDIVVATDRIERMTLAVPKLRQRVVGNPGPAALGGGPQLRPHLPPAMGVRATQGPVAAPGARPRPTHG